MEQIAGQLSFDEALQDRYTFYVCRKCSAHSDISGTCPFCHATMMFHTAIPVERILKIRDELQPSSVSEFVDLLLHS